MHHEICVEKLSSKTCSFNEIELDELLIIASNFRALFTSFSKDKWTRPAQWAFTSASLLYLHEMFFLQGTYRMRVDFNQHALLDTLVTIRLCMSIFKQQRLSIFKEFLFIFIATGKPVISTTLLGDTILKPKKSSNKYTWSHTRHARWSLRIAKHVWTSGCHKQCNNAVEWNVFSMEHYNQNNFWITEALELKKEWDPRRNPWEK